MSDQQLFDSKSQPIPPLRPDLQLIPVQENGNVLLFFRDQRGYATPDFALNREAGQLLTLFDGQKSINDLESYMGNGVGKDDLLTFIRFLDKNRLLASDYFEQYAEEVEQDYEQSDVHPSVTAGSSYPQDPDELKQYLDKAFAGHDSDQSEEHAPLPKALYAPHIDPRVALESYVKAFTPIRTLKPKRVVLLATSHYAGFYPEIYHERPFVLVNKDFKLPLGTIRRDKQTIRELINADTQAGITTRDRAHRMEHSIELHLLFLSYLWNQDFRIVPFLIRGLDELYYMKKGALGQQLANFSALLSEKFSEDDNTFFLISGDLAHFGKKFGDRSAASTMFDEVATFDQQFLKYGSQNDRSALLDLMKENYDPYRICGFPPLYTFLQSMPDLKGEILSYDLWDERERNSAVTFGSILYK